MKIFSITPNMSLNTQECVLVPIEKTLRQIETNIERQLKMVKIIAQQGK